MKVINNKSFFIYRTEIRHCVGSYTVLLLFFDGKERTTGQFHNGPNISVLKKFRLNIT